jgi:hypothetical protein
MLLGIALGIVYRGDKFKKGVILACTLIISFLLFIPIYLGMRSIHTDEIKRVISERGGTVTNIDHVSEDSLFESGSANTIYRITYKKNGKEYVAWYRGVNNFSDIHSKDTRKSFEEKWIFNE